MLADPERWHTDEQVAYLVFGQSQSQPSNPNLRTGVTTGVTNTGWTTVNLGDTYNNMVVVATANYVDNDVPLVTRIDDVGNSSFKVQVQRADNSTAPINSSATVYFTVVEAGVYNTAQHGVKMEAFTFDSSLTDHAATSWVGTSRGYAQSYAAPVVVGQVMSSNDPDFSVFWARGAAAGLAPAPGALHVGKHVGGDTDTTRATEQIGYIVIESGSGSIGGMDYVAGVGANTVVGSDNGPAVTYPLSGLSSVTSAVVSSAGMNGSDGGWPVLSGINAVSPSGLKLVAEEDKLGDIEQWHTTEEMAYLVFGQDGSPLRGQATLNGLAASNAAAVLTQAQAEEMASQALAAWASVLDVTQLPDIDVSVADLPGDQLGLATGSSIILDVDAGGMGWFVDSTPLDNSEFDSVQGQASLVADSDSPAAKQYDLLTVLAHEIGHTLGQGHAGSDQLMAETLELGVRRLPSGSASLELLGDDLLDDLADDVAGVWNR